MNEQNQQKKIEVKSLVAKALPVAGYLALASIPLGECVSLPLVFQESCFLDPVRF